VWRCGGVVVVLWRSCGGVGKYGKFVLCMKGYVVWRCCCGVVVVLYVVVVLRLCCGCVVVVVLWWCVGGDGK